MPAWLAPAITGVAGLVGNLFSNQGSKKREEEARDFNLEQWQRQNAYNHPTEQMARLKEAGLNPNMIYGGSPGQATGNAGAVAPGKAPEYDMNIPVNGLDFDKAKQLRAQTSYTQANEEIIALRNQEQIFKNAIKSNDKDLSNFALDLKKQKIASELKGIQANTQIAELNADHLNQTQKQRIADTLLQYKLNKYKEEPAKLMSNLAKNGLTIHDNKIIRMIATASENPEQMDAFINNFIKFSGGVIGNSLGAFGNLIQSKVSGAIPLDFGVDFKQ